VPLYNHMVPWSSSSVSAVLRNHEWVSEFCVHFLLNFFVSAIPASSPHGGKHLKILIFKRIWRFQLWNTMPNQKRSHRLRPHQYDRWTSQIPPKRPQSPPPSPEGRSLDLILYTLLQLPTEMKKLSKQISMMEPHSGQHSQTFAPSQAPPDDQILVLTYSDGELVDYSRLCLFAHWATRQVF